MSAEEKTRRTAGAFDIRTFIASLMGIYGVILLLAGLLGDDRTADSTTNGSAINLIVGIGLLAFAAVMQGWAMARPVVVSSAPTDQ